ncbi:MULTISPECIES: hypothetical protein [Lactobacillus]|uniref:Uncharacterized protein n=1 Tax=Lactobacillus xujianguonis TaxID=2495899 RepID=A0A437SU53_9LACO|nr:MULTISPECIES: hypothetical protein [Lactobacillus]RVU70445.1 hypothetical protein EJK17_07555 [Lactobacillus xujianguonis]RVU73152.1 hypothetical protein EJK20_09460 [Lactobacillus xujianguonis]
MENKSVQIDTDYDKHALNIKFSDNLTDDRERGYILSAAFLSFCASQGLDKQEVIEMINTNYSQFTDQDGSTLFKRL